MKNCSLDLRLNEPAVFLPNSQNATHALLQGQLVLTLTANTHLNRVQLAFYGEKVLDTVKSRTTHVWHFCPLQSDTAHKHTLPASKTIVTTDIHGASTYTSFRGTVTPCTVKLVQVARAALSDNLACSELACAQPASRDLCSFVGRVTARPVSARPVSARPVSARPVSANPVPSPGPACPAPPGVYTFAFALAIGCDVYESMDLGRVKVRYLLEATVEAQTWFGHRTMHTRRTVRLVREPNRLDHSALLDTTRCWRQQLRYSICIPRRHVCVSDALPLTLQLEPLAPGLCVRHIAVFVDECFEPLGVTSLQPTRRRFELYADSTPTHAIKCLVLDLPLTQRAVLADKRRNWHAPSSLQPDSVCHNLVKVHHRLLVRLGVSLQERVYEISVDAPLALVARECSQDSLALPPYSSHRRCVAYTEYPLHSAYTDTAAKLQTQEVQCCSVNCHTHSTATGGACFMTA